MKKSIFLGFIAFTALTMMSCNNDETTAALFEDNAIEFGVYAGRSPQKAPGVQQLDNTTLKNFGVFASYTEDANWAVTNKLNFMFDQLVTGQPGNFSYSPKKYWPATNDIKEVKEPQKISFFAYAPFYCEDGTTKSVTLVSTNQSTGAPKVEYSVTSAVDFSAAVRMNVSKENNDETDEKNTVKFVFKHELTRVNFHAYLDRDAFDATAANKTKINITDVQIANKLNTFVTKATYTFATTDGARGTWTAQEQSQYTVGGELNKTQATDLGDYQVEGVQLENTTPVPLFGTDGYLFLIPIDGGIKVDEEVCVTFTYDIVTADPALDGGYAISNAKKTVYLPTGGLQQGVAYNYNFKFGLHEIKVDAEVEDWGAEGNGGEEIVDWEDLDQ